MSGRALLDRQCFPALENIIVESQIICSYDVQCAMLAFNEASPI